MENGRLRGRIAGTGSVLPGPSVTTRDLVERVPGAWDAARIARRPPHALRGV